MPPATRPVPRLPPRGTAHRIASDAEAIAAAHRLAAEFAKEASDRDRERRLPWAEMEAYSDSGLLAMTVPKPYGGAEVSAATLAEVVATACWQISAVVQDSRRSVTQRKMTVVPQP